MLKWSALTVIFLLIGTTSWADTPAKIRRICKNGTTNNLFFTPTTDTCTAGFKYEIWARNGLVGPFSLLDSVFVKSQDSYNHIGANPIGSPTKWSYYIVVIDSCSLLNGANSDTLFVDETPPNQTIIDSVSVDPLTNKVHIGWSQNNTSDFYYYILYADSQGVYVPIYSGNDTFSVDNRPSSKPQIAPIKYDISPVDSCGNAKVFGINPHQTINLTHNLDTCTLKVTLNWTPYLGWSSVEKYYIYKKTAPEITYVLIDSLPGTFLTLTDNFTPGIGYSYFVRAQKQGSIITAASNSTSFITRNKVYPTSSYISSVSMVKPKDELITIEIYNPGQEVNKYDVFSSKIASGPFQLVGSINNASANINEYALQIPFLADNKYFYAKAIDACENSFPTSNVSIYTSLVAAGQGYQNNLVWERYFTWNVGIKYYNIYRGTNDNNGNIIYSYLANVSATDTSYIDAILPSTVGENGLCYFVEAVQNNGDINPFAKSALSISSCVTGDLKVFVPNAFRPLGYNSMFRPEGSYIDYDQSEMEIYNRWGQQVVSIKGIRLGWDGKENSGQYCEQGVYFYQINITSTNGKKEYIKGTVTLLN